MRAGFLGGAIFIIGVIVGTFVIAPLMHHETRPPAIAPQQKTGAPGDLFERLRAQANAAMDAGRCEDAIAAYERALSIRFDADLATDRGVCLRQLGRRHEALAAFELVMLNDPSHWQARYNLTAMLIELGRTEDAKGSLAILKKQRPDDPAVKALEQAFPRKP